MTDITGGRPIPSQDVYDLILYINHPKAIIPLIIICIPIFLDRFMNYQIQLLIEIQSEAFFQGLSTLIHPNQAIHFSMQL